MEPYNLIEECLGDGRGAVGVAQGDEAGILGEEVHHREDHRLAADLGEPFNEIQGNVSLDGVWNVQRLQQASRMVVLCLVPLAHKAALHEVADKPAGVGAVEGGAQVMQRLLDALMADAVRCGQDLRPQS
jgi:hypothetical protein